MKMKKLLALFLGATMLLSSATAINASAVTTDKPATTVSHDARGATTASGETETGLLWDLTDGVLTISTNGTDTAMESYYSGTTADWHPHKADIESVVIEDGVTSIGDYAFDDCVNLASVTIPDSVTSIGEDAFDNCTMLSSVTIPDSVTSIGLYAFGRCRRLTSVTIPDGVTEIGEGTFEACTSLTSVTIGNGVTEIGTYAFSSCKSLTSVTIPDGVTEIGEGAFSSCKSLTLVTIPDSVTDMYYPFGSCNSLKAIYFTGNRDSAQKNSIKSLLTHWDDNYYAPIVYLEGGDVEITGDVIVELDPEDPWNGPISATGEHFVNPVRVDEDGTQYIFKGYYDSADSTTANPMASDFLDTYTDKSEALEAYAGWLPIGTVAKADDGKITGKSTYNEVELFGVQIRDTGKNDGLRFMVALSKNIYDTLSSLDGNQNAVDYGFIAGSKAKLDLNAEGTKLENGTAHSTKVSCASDGAIDHYNGTDYRLYTLVITYKNADDPDMGKDVVARAYLKYTDANGVERYYYSNYDSPTAYAGGCCTNYNAAKTYIDNVLRA